MPRPTGGPACSVWYPSASRRPTTRPSRAAIALPFDYLCFVPVPEPKAAKNRIHWDVVTADIPGLVAKGARVLREPDGDISWHVLGDPEGNEFCADAPE